MGLGVDFDGVFEGFQGFRLMASYPGYSADFFSEGRYYVIRGRRQ